jgi:hypothetical protein
MTSVRKTKKIIKIGARAEALNNKIQQLNAPEITKVPGRTRIVIGRKVGNAIKALNKLADASHCKHGSAYAKAIKSAAVKMAGKPAGWVVKKAQKER